MSTNDDRSPAEILTEILIKLQSADASARLAALMALRTIAYSSEAVRNQLERLAASDSDQDVRAQALAALDMPTQRNVRSRLNKVDGAGRNLLLREIKEWEALGLLDKASAEVIRRRYDFDLVSPPAEPASATRSKEPPAQPAAGNIPSGNIAEVGPRPTLLQTLLSEASIKIYLYLGAFFVIASASIIGAAVPELRLPILIIGTLIFGGLSVGIKRRLPQPSFALFIVFSFLFPITAKAIEAALQQNFDLSAAFLAGYWAVVYFGMAIIWGGSTWLYSSRLFSVTAFISLTLAFLRLGDLFAVDSEFYATLTGVAALCGLAGVKLLRAWKDSGFALPLFLTAQLIQAIVLISSISIFTFQALQPSGIPLWHLASLVTWGLACGFYIISELLYPFVFFPWLAAGALIPLPWFLIAAFDIQALGSTIVMLIWGIGLTMGGESIYRFENIRKYNPPVLLASLPTFVIGIGTGLADSSMLGLIAALVVSVIYAAAHFIRGRWWLWSLALLSFTIAYFAFFDLAFIEGLAIFNGYKFLGISLLFLLPDLFLKGDLHADGEWRLPPRIYGSLFALYLSIILLASEEFNHAAVCYAAYALFFAVYALKQRTAIFGYLPAAYLPLTVVFALRALDVDAWLPALTVLAVLYFVTAVAIRSRASWSKMLRISALALGTLFAFAALSMQKETAGWYVIVVGLLFAAEMYLSRNGWWEIGMPVMFSIAAFLILRDFNFERVTYYFLAGGVIWILTDLLAHLTFINPRPLKTVIRAMGGLLVITSYIFLITESDAGFAAMGFAIFSLLFLAVSLLYRRPLLFYTFTLTAPLFVIFLSRYLGVTQWIHPVIIVAVLYYGLGFFFRPRPGKEGWDTSLLYSGLGLGVFVSMAAPILGGLDAAIPVAVAATLWAVEAFARRNAWLALPANVLYLLAYFIILFELNVSEAQFFSIGAALLGLIQHYLLVRAGAKTGAFTMGMLSQFILLGTTYIEMLNKSELTYFFVLFFQSLVVLSYGLVIRSRSLTLFPIAFVALGVITLINSALEGVGAIFVIGCTGIILLILGVFAVLMRERISRLGERLSDWQA